MRYLHKISGKFNLKHIDLQKIKQLLEINKGTCENKKRFFHVMNLFDFLLKSIEYEKLFSQIET